MRLPKFQLHTKIFIAMVLGAGFGILANRFGFSNFVINFIKPIGSVFIKLISMIVVPLVFASLLVGTASLKNTRKLGRIGGKTILYFLVTTAIAITIGLLLANIVSPGSGLCDEAAVQSAQVDKKLQNIEKPGAVDTILDIIPLNPLKALTDGRMLQIIFFALVVGIALTFMPEERAEPVLKFFTGINDVMVQLVHIIMKLAPYGVFALIAAVVADFGFAVLANLLKYSLVVIAGLIIHSLIIYSLAIKLFTKMKVKRFFTAIRQAQLIAFSTSSSAATLPITMECVQEEMGVSRQVASFTLPLGATMNMDGTALVQGVAAFFIAEVFGVDLTLAQQITIVVIATLASVATAAVPGVGMITLAMVLQSVGLPLEGVALVLGVDRILDMCRTSVNITGDACCAVVVASTEGEDLKLTVKENSND